MGDQPGVAQQRSGEAISSNVRLGGRALPLFRGEKVECLTFPKGEEFKCQEKTVCTDESVIFSLWHVTFLSIIPADSGRNAEGAAALLWDSDGPPCLRSLDPGTRGGPVYSIARCLWHSRFQAAGTKLAFASVFCYFVDQELPTQVISLMLPCSDLGGWIPQSLRDLWGSEQNCHHKVEDRAKPELAHQDQGLKLCMAFLTLGAACPAASSPFSCAMSGPWKKNVYPGSRWHPAGQAQALHLVRMNVNIPCRERKRGLAVLAKHHILCMLGPHI